MAQKRYVGELFNAAGVLLPSLTVDHWFIQECAAACAAAVGSNNVASYRVCDSWCGGMVVGAVPAQPPTLPYGPVKLNASAPTNTSGLAAISDKTIVLNQNTNSQGTTTDFQNY